MPTLQRLRASKSAPGSARSWVSQFIVLASLALLGGWLWHNMAGNLASRGITVGFDFLGRAARFPISESFLRYSSVDSFGWAFVVGLSNTLFLSLLVIACATALGFFVALARRARNPLGRGLATTFVEVTRNTPLVVQLLFWYAAVTVGLRPSADAANPIDGVYLTDRGVYLPRPEIHGDGTVLLGILALGIGLMLAAALYQRRRRIESGRQRHPMPFILAATLVAATIAWIACGLTLSVDFPKLGRFNFSGGVTLTPEFVAITLGLMLYSAAFIGETIRGGIESIDKGQWEAGRAIGLSERQALRLIVVPQALRIIVPPMTSQYINIVKNSTLALVVGYPELNFVTATTINQTGQAIEGILILMLAFLTISTGASLLMNWYNRRLAEPGR